MRHKATKWSRPRNHTRVAGWGLVLAGLLSASRVAYAQTWSRMYGGVADDSAAAVAPMPDCGFVIAGTTESFGEGRTDVWVVRLDAIGDVVWEKTLGGTEDDIANAVLSTEDGKVIVAGRTTSFGLGGSDAWLVK